MSCALFMGMAGKNITENRKEGAKEMQKTEEFCVDESGWIHCPFCKCRTRTKIRADTSLKNFPIFCPKCKQECLIDVDNMKIRLSVVPDAKTQSR
ncbi:MAG: cysteine-rich KTR domain-containing protein [Acutalibacteraceae bacterium]